MIYGIHNSSLKYLNTYQMSRADRIQYIMILQNMGGINLNDMTDEEYKEIYRLLMKVKKENDQGAADKLYKMFEPYVEECSIDPITKKYNSKLNKELKAAMYKAMLDFEVEGVNN